MHVGNGQKLSLDVSCSRRNLWRDSGTVREPGSRATLRVSEQDPHLCELRTVPETPQLQTMVDVKGQLQALFPRYSTEHILFNK